MFLGSVTERAALSQAKQAIWKVWAHSANGFVVSRNRPNASKDGIACKLMDSCSALSLSERRWMISMSNLGKRAVARVVLSSIP